jgi:hypothetical protein
LDIGSVLEARVTRPERLPSPYAPSSTMNA